MSTEDRKLKFHVYITRVLKQVHPDTGMTASAMVIMNDYVLDVFHQIMKEAIVLLELSGKNTMTAREIQTGVRFSLPGELAKHAVSEGTKAVTKFCSSPAPKNNGKVQSKSAKAGLVFPVGKIHTLMKTKYPGRIAQGAPIYLAAVMEYMVAEVLELSGNAARDNRKMRIIPRHIMLAIKNDEELWRFCQTITFAGGGVLPHIHARLLPPKVHQNKGGFEY